MLLGFLYSAIAFAAPPEGGEGALAAAGERLGVATIFGVETHPEYERYALIQPDGSVTVVELTSGEGGFCEADGLTIFPRPELADGVDGRAGTDELCARLAERRPRLRERIGAATPAPTLGRGDPTAPATGRETSAGDPRRVPPLRHLALDLAIFALLAAAAVRVKVDRTLVAVGLFALAVRLVGAPWGVTNGDYAGYEKLVFALGAEQAPPYGLGWGAVMGVVPAWPDGVFGLNLVLAALSAPLLAALVRREAGLAAGVAAGLLLAVLPSHVAVSASETMHVSVFALVLVSALAARAWARGGRLVDAALAALATGVAVHVRPEALCFLPALALLAWPTWSGAAAAPVRTRDRIIGVLLAAGILGGLAAWALSNLAPQSGDLLRLPGLHALLPVVDPARGGPSFQVFLHAGYTSPAAWGLAAVGAVAGWRRGHRAFVGACAVWIAALTLPFVAKAWPSVDATRLQLLAQAPWVALAGLGVAALPRWVLPLALLTFVPYFPIRPWVQTEEWQFLRAHVPELHTGETVRFDGRPHRAAWFGAVMAGLGPARWSPDEGELRYVGISCLVDGGCDTAGCEAVYTTRLVGRADLDIQLQDRTIGLYRCPAGTGAWPR